MYLSTNKQNIKKHVLFCSNTANLLTTQPTVVMHISVDLHNLYRVLLRYVNPTTAPITGTVSFVTYLDGKEGSNSAEDCLDCKWESILG